MTSTKTQFLVPVFITVVADSPEEAQEVAASSLDYMLEVSNDDRSILHVAAHPGHQTLLPIFDDGEKELYTIKPPFSPRAVVALDGGLVQSVAAGFPLDVMVVDYDVEGADAGELSAIDQGDGTTADAACSAWTPINGVTVSERRLEEIWESPNKKQG